MPRPTSPFRPLALLLVGFILGVLADWAFQHYTSNRARPVESQWHYPVPDPTWRFYVDRAGRKVFPQQFEDCRHFSDGLAMVQVGGKWGFINLKGETVIPPAYEQTHGFHEGLAGVKVGGAWGFIDWRGNLVIEPRFKDVSVFREGLAPVRVGDAWGYVDATGRMVIEPQFAEVGPFSEALAGATADGKTWGFIDRAGRFVILPSFQAVRGYGFEYGAARVMVGAEWKRVDWKGEFVE